MYICFVCNAETEAMKKGLIPSYTDVPTAEGLSKVRETAEYIVEIIDDVMNKKPVKSADGFGDRMENVEVYLYSGDQIACAQTSMVLAEVFKKHGLLSDKNMFFCQHLNGRIYGDVEGLPQKEVKSLKYALKKPKHTISYMLADAGFDNAAHIESTERYANGVFRFLKAINVEYDLNDDAVVVVSSTPDFFKSMQTHRDVRHLCYSGANPKECSIAPCDIIHPGDLRFVEVNMLKAMPKYEMWAWDEDFLRFETRKFPKEIVDMIDEKVNASGYSKGEE